jgi:hypothetical protein
MTGEDVKQELEREPFTPLRLHLASGQKIDIPYPNTAWVRQNTLVIVFPLERGSAAIGNYDVVALRLIERIEQRNGRSGPDRPGKKGPKRSRD